MLKGISLFSNVGIAETYLHSYVNMFVANELLSIRAKFYQEMYPNTKMIQGNILDKEIFNKITNIALENKCDFLIATPPCQGMSIAGKQDKNDSRNILITKVVEAIKIIKPKYFLIENVLAMPKTNIFVNNKLISIETYLKEELLNEYNFSINFIDTKDFEIPQSRKRTIVLGTLKSFNEWKIPNKVYRKITVRDAIGDLPSLESGETSNVEYHYAKKHNENHILWLKNTPTGKTALDNLIYYPQKPNGDRIKGFKTTYKRIEWDKPAPTITMANGSISSQNNVHPGRLKEDGTYSDARVLTLKEIFRLSSLPENWQPPIWASENLIRQVIGEGVPPKLIEELVNSLLPEGRSFLTSRNQCL